MKLLDIPKRARLFKVWKLTRAGDVEYAVRLASIYYTRYNEDIRFGLQLADANIFAKNYSNSIAIYKRILEKGETGPIVDNADKRFLNAYATHRIFEAEFLLGKHKNIAKSSLVKKINNLPSKASLKTLFSMSTEANMVPAPLVSKRA